MQIADDERSNISVFPMLKHVAPSCGNRMIIDWRKQNLIINDNFIRRCVVWEKLSSVRMKKTTMYEKRYYEEIENRFSIIERRKEIK